MANTATNLGDTTTTATLAAVPNSRDIGWEHALSLQVTSLTYAVILAVFLALYSKRLIEMIEGLVKKVLSIEAVDLDEKTIRFVMTEAQARVVVNDILHETLHAYKNISRGDLRIFQAIYHEAKRGRTITANELFLMVEGPLPDEAEHNRIRQGERLGFVRFNADGDPDEQERKDKLLSPLERQRLDRLRRLRGINLIRPAEKSYWGPHAEPVLSAFAEYIIQRDPQIRRKLTTPPDAEVVPTDRRADQVRDD